MNALLKHVTKQLFISLLLFPVFALSGNGGNYIIVQDVDANAEDIIQVEIHVENTESVIAIEFNFHYPNDVMTFLPGPEYTYLTDRAQNHILNIAPDTEGGSLYIFVIDLGQLAPFTGNSGALLKIGFEINAADTGLSFPLTLSDAILSNEIGEDVLDEAIDGQLFIIDDDETIPETLVLDEHIIEEGEEVCYDASETIILSGDDGWFWVQQGGNVTLIAGNNIIMKPGTQVDAGGYLHARIAIDEDDFCGIPVADDKEDDLITDITKNPQTIKTKSVKLFPNPTHADFTVELLNHDTAQKISIEVYDVYGNRLVSEQNYEAQHQLSLSGQPAGIYFVRISNGDYSEIVRLIKR